MPDPTQSQEVKLKPCPFCGGEAVRMQTCGEEKAKFSVRCRGCWCMTDESIYEHVIVRSWNTRANDKQAEDVGVSQQCHNLAVRKAEAYLAALSSSQREIKELKERLEEANKRIELMLPVCQESYEKFMKDHTK